MKIINIIKITFLRSIFLMLSLVGYLSAQAPVPQPPQINASSYILMDFNTGTVLAEREIDSRVEPASLTKLMTAYVIFKAIEEEQMSLNELVLVSERAWRTEGSRMFIEVGDQVRVDDLLRGMIIQSGNDASVALAEHLAGSEAAFANLMMYYADLLGMTGSSFMNATGLPDPNHYMTARDVATLAQAIISEFPNYYQLYSERSFTYNDIQQGNRNTLLRRDPSVDGLKTGYTDSAGYCLASSAIRDNMRLIAVVFGMNSAEARAEGSQVLLNYGFRFFETRRLINVNENVAEARILGGTPAYIPVGLGEEVFLTLPRGTYDDISVQVDINPDLWAPVDIGAQVGDIQILLNDSIVYENTLNALNSSEDAGYWQMLKDYVENWFQ
ncbi:MAG: D-alanyl-D-alanine carboxypeptidase family protein [Gammaproteobacteria bacterium]|jgi:D-alanyl-D-alanine carboxypeptidase (penicillin-binding protein 5/6)